MLLWDDSLIQIEVCRKKGKPCHIGLIRQILLNESDVYTVGDDGYIRVWDFETIDTADATDEGSKMEIEPLNELKVGNNSKLLGITQGAVNDMSVWFAQVRIITIAYEE
jgi:cilia- and flagella-associated protein 44